MVFGRRPGRSSIQTLGVVLDRDAGGAASPGWRAQLGGGKLAWLFGQAQMLMWELGYSR